MEKGVISENVLEELEKGDEKNKKNNNLVCFCCGLIGRGIYDILPYSIWFASQ